MPLDAFRSITGVITTCPTVECVPYVCMVDDMPGGVGFKTHIPECLQVISWYCLPQALSTVLGLLTYMLRSLSALRIPRAAVVGFIVQLLPAVKECLFLPSSQLSRQCTSRQGGPYGRVLVTLLLHHSFG